MSWRSTRAAGRTDQGNKQVAVIDLGSNSWRLVVFTYDDEGDTTWWKRTDELYEGVRIGAGMSKSGKLTEEAMARGLETLAVFDRFCVANGIRRRDVHAVATSAIRDAANGPEFLRRAHEETGMRVEILSAEDEARAGYVAAVNTTTLTDGVVLEIGGGSMQLIKVTDRHAHELESFPFGAVRLTEQFLPGGGPARKKDMQKLRDHVADRLSELKWLPKNGGRLVGIGGAVRNLAVAVQHGIGPLDLGIQGLIITRDALSDLVRQFASMPATERGEHPGIKPERGDIILAAALVLETVVKLGRFKGIEVTEAGMREGVFLARTLLAGRKPDDARAARQGDPGWRAGGRREPLFDDVREAAVRNLAVQYESDMSHVEHVATLALQMHDSLVKQELFAAQPGERELLWAASMLHDVGMTISYDDHHKHSRYLIISAELPGFDPRERMLIAQMSRYHRKGLPKLGPFEALSQPGDEELLERCSVILRLAEHLERGRDQSISEARLRANGHGVDLHLEADGDITLQRWSVERYGDDEAFQRVFGRRLLIG